MPNDVCASAKERYGLRVPPETAERQRADPETEYVVGLQLERMLRRAFGRVELTERAQRRGGEGVNNRRQGIELAGQRRVSERLLGSPCSCQKQTVVRVRHRRSGLNRNGLREMRIGLTPAALEVKDVKAAREVTFPQ